MLHSRTLVNHKFSIPVSTSSNEWVAAEILRDDFIHKEKNDGVVETTAELEDTAEATIELFARFLAFVADNIMPGTTCATSRTAVLLNAFKAFSSTHLSTKDLHNFVVAFDTDVRKSVLASYYRASAALQAQEVSAIPSAPSSALLTAAKDGSASVFGLFGGQGTNEVYFDELQSLYDIYKPFVTPFITSLTVNVLQPLASASTSSFFAYGLDVISWLAGAPRPPTEYLASIPVSFPLIGLTQLTQYLVSCHVAGITPGEMRARLQGTTGHSQGIVSAVAVAASDSFESFSANSSKALKWLFFSGVRGQEAFPVLALEPGMVADAIEGGEGMPSPMLSVAGLSLGDLEPHIKKTNKHLPSNSQLSVSLYNGPKTFVVTGPAKALYGLVTSLRKVRAQPGLEQSKIPYSQRRPVFSARFLAVGVPYHSDYLTGATEKVMQDLEGEELWKAKDLVIPVYHTEDGKLISLTICAYKVLSAY